VSGEPPGDRGPGLEATDDGSWQGLMGESAALGSDEKVCWVQSRSQLHLLHTSSPIQTAR
jgi:hypothetical protein